ncbi:MAG: hypothetical protein BEN19_08605 [Epulopiscium sp. Nuni2H_MBin003]|nr:MAG: hypothetical protein BEN19_08605 [Epulopiscium sp. Nuni2H_MBin003]
MKQIIKDISMTYDNMKENREINKIVREQTALKKAQINKISAIVFAIIVICAVFIKPGMIFLSIPLFIISQIAKEELKTKKTMEVSKRYKQVENKEDWWD